MDSLKKLAAGNARPAFGTVAGDWLTRGLARVPTAQGIGGAGPLVVAIGRGGTPAKPGFLRSKKCAQI
jgi:hypothetical protein